MKAPATTHYFHDSDSNRVNPPTFKKYILFPHNNIRRICLPRGLDNISPKPRFCTNLGAVRIPHVARAPSPVRLHGRARLQSCHKDQKTDSGTANPPDRTTSKSPAHLSSNPPPSKIISQAMEPFSILTLP